MIQSVLRLRSAIATVLLSTALAAMPTHAAGVHKRDGAPPSLKLHGTSVSDEQGRIQVFVQLDEPAVAELNAQSLETSGTFASSSAQRAQAARVSAQQSSFRSVLASHGAQILSSQRVAANGFRIRVRASEIESIRSLPGVRSVGRVELHKLDNIDSVPWIGAPAVWSSVGKGKGVKVGIIDSGIDYTHADFGGSGNPADYLNNDPNVVEPGSFPTAKVKGGIDFAGANYDARDPDSVPVPDGDPLDVVVDDPDDVGHGTHVAGTVAGIGVPGSVGAGVAPEADLYAIKVFGDVAGSTDLTSLGIEWAMDPNGDGDMSDHLDVINMSLGSPLGEPDDPSAISANNAAKVGIIVVASSGNEGNTPYVTGAPAIASSAISTAANSPGGRLYSRFTVNAPASVAGVYPSLEGAGPVTFVQTGPISGPLVPATPANGCAPLTNAAQVSGKIALIIRGVCGFIDKYHAALAAGAKAIVVYNDGAAPDRIDPIVMGGLDDTVTIPGLMISYTVGAKLAAATGVTVTLDAALDPSRDDQIADFSSRGPGHGGSTFKPDLSAPGVAIVSAGAGTGTGGLNLQGTSMAAPHAAGAAALLRQEHPKLNQGAIKALLQNSTVNSNASGDTDLARQGVGAIRVDKAVALSSYAAPGGISFGRLNPLTLDFRNESVTVRDLSGKRRTFSVTHVPHQTYPGVQVSCPNNVRVNANGQAKVQVSLRFDPRAAWKAGVYDNAIHSQTEVDGWCVFNDGKDSLRVGYLAVVDAASGLLVLPDNGLADVKVRNFGPALGWAEGFTLAKLGGEQQNRTYGSIAATGFRRGDPALYAGYHVIEFGFALERAFEHVSNLNFTLAIDTNNDGEPDAFLEGTDLSDYIDQDPGEYATLQFNADGDGFIDWAPITGWDFNDRVVILPFTLAADGGFVPEKFNYVLTVTARDGEQDVQRGTVDLSKEVVPDLNSFGVEPNGTVDVGLSGPTGTSLWLLQNNIPLAQPQLSLHIEKKKKKGR
jgi:subtilisin family serine protease